MNCFPRRHSASKQWIIGKLRVHPEGWIHSRIWKEPETLVLPIFQGKNSFKSIGKSSELWRYLFPWIISAFCYFLIPLKEEGRSSLCQVDFTLSYNLMYSIRCLVMGRVLFSLAFCASFFICRFLFLSLSPRALISFSQLPPTTVP